MELSAAIRAGYKQTEVGVIPEDWAVTTATEACLLVVDCKNRTPPVVADSDYAVVRTPNVRDGKFVLEDLRFTNEASYYEWTARAVPQFGDVMITREAPLGEVCAVPMGRNVCLGQRMMLYRPSPTKTDSIYLLYSLMSVPVRSSLMRKIGGSTVGHAKVDDIRFLQLPIPPLPEQRAIAAALSDVDALLAKLDEFFAKKRDLKQAAMQQLLTGQTRLPGFSGEWEVTRLGDVADQNQKWSFTGGPFGSNLKFSDYTNEGVRIIQLQNIGDGEFHDDYAIFTSIGKADELLSCNVYPGEILLSKMGDPVARACLVPLADERYLMCSDGIRLAIDQKRFNIQFVFYQINASDFRMRAENAGTGSTRKRIGLNQLRNLELTCPSLVEQTAIATILSDMDSELSALEARRDKTHALKQGMMQELLTGKIRLV